jgi:16S rRNA processing protein RimM
LRPAGRVGRAHGRDGSFYVNESDAAFSVGTAVRIGDRESVVERRAGTDERPLVRLAGIDGREVRGEVLLVDEPLAEGEYDAADLVGAAVPGVGTVSRVVNAPSCDVLVVGEVLIPFVSDAIVSVDVERRVIEVDRGFLGLDE